MQQKTEIITIRVDKETKRKLELIAQKEYRPLSMQIRKIIQDYLESNLHCEDISDACEPQGVRDASPHNHK